MDARNVTDSPPARENLRGEIRGARGLADARAYGDISARMLPVMTARFAGALKLSPRKPIK